MSKKFHSGLKRTLAWMLVVALTVQGCMVVYADDFTSEPDAAVVSEEISDADVDADNDLEVVEDEDTSDDVDISDDSNEDVDSDVTVEEEQADESGINEFSDGSDASVFADGAEAVGDDNTSDLKRDTGEITIAGNEKYSYTRLYDEKGIIKFAVGTYPANNSTVTIKVGDKKGLEYRTLYSSSTTQTEYKKASWSNYTSQNVGTYQEGVEWKSNNENVAKVVSNSNYGPYTTGVWVLGVGEGEATITSTWKPGKNFKDSDGNYTLGTITNTFTVKVEKAADPVEVGTPFTLNGSPSSPYQIAREGSSAAKLYWGRTSSANYSIPESTENFDNSGMTTCNASWNVWSETGEITHAFCINYAEMTGATFDNKKSTYDVSTYRGSVSSYSPGGTTDVFLRPCKMPADGIYVTGTGGSRGSLVNNNVVFDRVSSSESVYVYAYCIKNQKKVDSATFYTNIKWSSSDESVMKVSNQDKYSVQIRSYKAGTAILHGSYQPVDAEGNPDGEPLTIDIKVIVCGFYIDEKAEDGTNTIEMSLDDETTTRKIQYKVIDKTGEAEPTDTITWTVDKLAIASVDSDGVVKAKAAGEATVTAQYGDSSTNKDTVKIVVKGAGSLGFDKAESKIKKNGTDTIKATATYNGSTVRNADIKWESENPAIATVDNGKITGISEGTTTVKASWTAENGKTYTNNATVKVVYDGLYLSDAQNEVTLAQKSTQEIVWQLLDMGEYSKGSTGEGYNTSSDVTWTSANEDLVTVDSVGVITAKDLPEGEEKAETTVSVSYKGNKVKDIKVTVVKNQAITTGTTTDVAGTKGETKADKDGADKSNTWKTGAYKAGHGSLGSEFNSSANYLEIVDGTGSTASVKGKSPSQGYAYLSHKYYIPLTTGQLCGVWQGIAVKVTGAAGLYLNKSSVSMKMGESDTATIQGTYITESGEEWGSWANEKHPDFSTIHMIDGDTNVVTAAPDPKNGSVLKLTAVAPGKTTITVQFDTSTLTATCDVEVTSDARLVLTPADKLRVVQGDTQTIEAKAWDGSAYVENPEITWQSYNTKIATVDDKGGVTGVKKGSVGVAATWNGITSDPVQVTVVPSRTLNVTTTWDDDNNRDNKRPEKTTLQLTTTDGEKVGDPVELNAENEWKYTWKNLASEDEDGQHISYLVTAVEDDTLTANNYTAEVTRSSSDDEFVVTYKHEIEKTAVTANVTWDDADNQDGIRPKEVTLQLKADGEAVGDGITVKADSEGNWTKTWSNLPVNKEGAVGQAVVYTVEETGLPDGYTITTTKDEETGAITLKNSYTPKGVDIAVSVNWNDADNQDGLRPEFVEAELYAGDTSTGKKVKLTADNEWKATFEGFAVNKNGKPIEYSLVSTKADGYEIKTTGSATEGLVLNYTHAVKTVDVKATVVWEDGNNKDGVRPETVNLQLKAGEENYGDVITVNEKSNWTKTWTGLGEYKAGKKVVYTVEVVGLKGGEDGYTAKITGDAGTGFTVTATHVPAVAEIKASVNWDDADNQDAIRPELVEAELYAGDVSTGKKVKLTADNKWTASFGEMDLKKDGKTINYTLVATKVDGYDCVVEGAAAQGFTLKYTHTTYKTDVTVTTKWDDAENQDGIRPNTYSVQLTADGETVGDAITLNEAGSFTKTWKGLEKNKAGKAITYSVKASDIAKGYEAAVSSTESGIVVTLTHTPEVADIAVSAAWDDADNQDALRPASVEAEVLANGEATGNKVTLTAEGEWKATVKALPVYAAGQKITYTLKSDVDAYTSACTSTADGLVLKFTHKTETVDVTLTTKWNDKENQDGNRPSSYSVQLMADGVKVGDLITLNAGNEFSKTWTGLQKNRTGKVGEAIVYTAEATVPNPDFYETSVSGDAATGLVVTNTYVPATVEIPVSVKWDDAENQDGARLDSVEAELYADGVATGNKVTLNAGNNWTAKFAKVDVKKDGTRIKYEVKSTEKEGYTVTVSGNILEDEGLTLTYKHVPATVNVSAAAAWNDADNQDGIRPTDTLVQLYANGSELGDKAVIESDKSWTKTWENLPKYKEGKEIEYTVIAYAVSGYTVKVTGNAAEGFKAEYTHNVQKTKVTVKNTWSDLDNVVDSRPAKLVVEIYANGKATGRRVTLTASNKWTAAVTNLNKNAAGKAISYTGKVVGAPKGYSISIKAANGTVNVTSKYTTFTKKLKLKLSKTSYVYTGKNLKPTVTVYNGNKKVSSKYYTVTYKNNKNTGYATVIVKGKGKFAKYAGKATFTIKPKTMKNPVVKKGAKKTLNVSWRRDAQATKYVVQYSQSSKFKGKTTKTVTINNNKTGKTVLKGLTSRKNYYVRVRSCKVVNGKEIWGAYSKATKMKVK